MKKTGKVHISPPVTARCGNPVKGIIAAALVSLAALLSSTSAAAGDVIALDLDISIEMALDRNHVIKSAREQVSKSYAQIDENSAAAWPELDFKADYTRLGNLDEYDIGGRTFSFVPEDNYRLDLNIKQKIYAPEVFEAIKASRTFAGSAEMEFEVIMADTIAEVKKAFYLYLFSKDMIYVNEEAVDQLKRHVADVRSRLDVGLATDFDLLRAEVQYANAIPPLTRARNELILAGAGLRIATGIDPSEDISVSGELEYTPFDITPEAAIETAMERRPAIEYTDYYIRSLGHNVEVSRKEFQPKLSLHGSLAYANDDLSGGGDAQWGHSWNVGVTLDYKLFDGWKRGSRIRQNLADLTRARIEKDSLVQRIDLEVRTAYGRLEEARELILSQEKNIENAKRAYEIAEAGNMSGVVTELELMDSQLALTEARGNYKRAVYDWITAMIEMERAMGTDLNAPLRRIP